MNTTKKRIPHIVQYQGSKRKLAAEIMKYMPERFSRIIEPFAGMAAISIAVAYEQRADKFLLNDINEPLVNMLKEAVENPGKLVNEYSHVWSEQFKYGDRHAEHFYEIRDKFNKGEKTPANILYLLARCVKGAVRYNNEGMFNQSPDRRRHGTSPQTLKANVYAVSYLMKGRTSFLSCDYQEILECVRSDDIIYMDPPYCGVSDTGDKRYVSGVDFTELRNTIELLNRRGIKFILSYDGSCGGKIYGYDLPEELGCTKISLDAGISAQHIFLGKKAVTFESLYISRTLMKNIA